jgi:hypothetical protein
VTPKQRETALWAYAKRIRKPAKFVFATQVIECALGRTDHVPINFELSVKEQEEIVRRVNNIGRP